jgi:hypothetical protein
VIDHHNPWERELTDDERRMFRRAAYHLANSLVIHAEGREWIETAVEGLVALSLLGDGQTVFGYGSDMDGTMVSATRLGRVCVRLDELDIEDRGVSPADARELAQALSKAADAAERQAKCVLTQDFFRKIDERGGV